MKTFVSLQFTFNVRSMGSLSLAWVGDGVGVSPFILNLPGLQLHAAACIDLWRSGQSLAPHTSHLILSCLMSLSEFH